MTSDIHAGHPAMVRLLRRPRLTRSVVGGFNLSMGGVHLGIVAADETTICLLLLNGGKWAQFGWGVVIAFHLALMLFGWGFWLWSVPALAFLIPAARSDWSHELAPANGGGVPRHTGRGWLVAPTTPCPSIYQPGPGVWPSLGTQDVQGR